MREMRRKTSGLGGWGRVGAIPKRWPSQVSSHLANLDRSAAANTGVISFRLGMQARPAVSVVTTLASFWLSNRLSPVHADRGLPMGAWSLLIIRKIKENKVRISPQCLVRSMNTKISCLSHNAFLTGSLQLRDFQSDKGSPDSIFCPSIPRIDAPCTESSIVKVQTMTIWVC